jgi:hypothetical protein
MRVRALGEIEHYPDVAVLAAEVALKWDDDLWAV